MRGRTGFVAAGLVIFGVLLLPASALGAAEASGCSGSATSFDADGKKVDTVTANPGGGSGGTSSDPFEIDPEGTVKWEASADPPIPEGTWSVETKSTPKLSFGGDGGLESDSDTETMSDHLVVDVPLLGETRIASGKFYVKVVVEGPGGTCTFAGYVKIGGSPLGTPLFWGGLILGVIGIVLAFTATPTATATAGAGPTAEGPPAEGPAAEGPAAEGPAAEGPAAEGPAEVPPDGDVDEPPTVAD
jgi:hypothetical protein